jgi:hypothetical protein
VTLEALRALYKPEHVPTKVADPGMTYQVPAEVLSNVLCPLPRASALGPSGWSYEHIQAAATALVRGV